MKGRSWSRAIIAFSKYYKNPEATDKALRDGWWYSGDAGNIDEHGHIIFMDRVSELGELRSGDKYAPQYIESGLRYSTYIKDAMAIGEKTRDYRDGHNHHRFRERGTVGRDEPDRVHHLYGSLTERRSGSSSYERTWRE